MTELPAGLSANRSVALELRDERRLVREGYELLDEKRVLLATEMLRRLAAHQALKADWLERYRQARLALGAAIAAQGIEGIQLYPVARRGIELATGVQRIAGVAIAEVHVATLEPRPGGPTPSAIWPSGEIETCAAAFVAIVELGARIAVEEQNLRRLGREYQRTDRRARALENVLLPELEEALRFVDEQLEYLDTEEAVRVHEAHRRRSSTDSAGGTGPR